MLEKVRLQSAFLVSPFETLGGTFKAAGAQDCCWLQLQGPHPAINFKKLQGIHKSLGFIMMLVSF